MRSRGSNRCCRASRTALTDGGIGRRSSRGNTMEIFATGGNGLLGHHTIQALLDRGDRVRVLALPGEDVAWLEDRDVVVHRGDIRDPETLVKPMDGADAVLHLAGMMGAWLPLEDYLAVNLTGPENVCRAALAHSV